MLEISRSNDYFARYFFANAGNEDILLDLINSFMKDSKFNTFKSVKVLNPFNLKEKASDKESVLDVKATTDDGKTVIIEIQVFGNRVFIKRALYYLTYNYSKVISDGDDYSKLTPVISINILNFILNKNSEKSHTCYLLHEKDTGELLTNDLEIHFLELPKNDNNLNDDLSVWETFFTTDSLEENMPKMIEKKPIMEKVIDRYKKFTSDETLMKEYKNRIEYQLGYKMVMDEEFSKGIEQGEHSKAITIAKNMKQDGVDIKTIIKYSGLSEEEIEKL